MPQGLRCSRTSGWHLHSEPPITAHHAHHKSVLTFGRLPCSSRGPSLSIDGGSHSGREAYIPGLPAALCEARPGVPRPEAGFIHTLLSPQHQGTQPRVHSNTKKKEEEEKVQYPVPLPGGWRPGDGERVGAGANKSPGGMFGWGCERQEVIVVLAFPPPLKKNMEVKFVSCKTGFILKNSAAFSDSPSGASTGTQQHEGLCPLHPTRPGAWGAATGHLN